ncbi:EamA family transporter [Massilia eurypsychrophila]|uniref:EamA family transporter n=1 Tax=Massilia eurypsychrophila TaxID=1485217 RepID=A0A2G8TIW0_9BURK|nr:EamA family transporter [Massilia eurypsychrophila]
MVSGSTLSLRDYVAALGVVLIWGTNFIAMKFALHDMTPFQLGAGRYLFAVLPLILIVPRPKLPWKWVVLYGLLQGVGQFGCLFIALNVGMSGALGSVLMQTQVFFTALFGFVLLREHANRSLLAGLFLAALGITCFALNYLAPGADTGGTTVAGFVLVLGAAAMWAASNIVVRRAQQATPQFEVVPFMVWSSLVPIIPFALLSLAFDAPATRWQWTQAPLSTWLSLTYLGWFATILAYALWTGLLKRHALNRVAPFSLGVPVVGISSGMLVLGESVSAWQWAGVTLVVAALATVMFGPRFLEKRG